MSENALSADNQQGSRTESNKKFGRSIDTSETTRRTPFKSDSEVYAYLQGAMHDASLNKKKRIRFGQKYPQWLHLLEDLLISVGVHSWMYKEGKNRDYYILETVCKNLDFSFDPRTLVTKGEKIAYIRGFFDAEGGIPQNNGKFYIQLVQKNLRKINKIQSE